MIPASEVLTVLHKTRDRLQNPRMVHDHGDWTTCTCGHLYAATVGRRPRSWQRVAYAEHSRYAAVVVAVAEALGWDGKPTILFADQDSPGSWAGDFLSALTVDRSDFSGPVSREDALSVIDDAIRVIEAQLARDRADVLGQLRRVVDDARVLVGVS